jgi:SAM-dependent methyltransferase
MTDVLAQLSGLCKPHLAARVDCLPGVDAVTLQHADWGPPRVIAVDDDGFRQRYRELVKEYTERLPLDQAMHIAVGGEFEAVGVLERQLLIQHGLRVDDYIVDVGCGSGRLAKALREYLRGKYLGLDVVPELIEYARTLVGRADWRFEIVEGFRIPEEDQRVDVVCFFSVFTHLLHEHAYLYLQEARRVLKPGGKIVLSFLEFANQSHWPWFEQAIRDASGPSTLIQFTGRDAIAAWAEHLDLRIDVTEDGDKATIALASPLTLESGAVLEERGALGQSVCVLSVPLG